MPNPSIRYFSTPAGNPIFLKMQDLPLPVKEILSRDKRDMVQLETRYFSVTLPRSVNTSGLAREIAGSVRWWKKFDLAEELDNLYQKVLQTTELYKSGGDKIKIDFRESFYYLKNDSATTISTPALYFFEKETIYVLVKKVTREVMAHEMAHVALHLFTGMKLSRPIDEAVAMWVAGQFAS